MSQQKDNSGVLFRNSKKEKPIHPDYTGDCTIGGIDYRIAGWIKQSKRQQTSFISFAFSPKPEDALK